MEPKHGDSRSQTREQAGECTTGVFQEHQRAGSNFPTCARNTSPRLYSNVMPALPLCRSIFKWEVLSVLIQFEIWTAIEAFHNVQSVLKNYVVEEYPENLPQPVFSLCTTPTCVLFASM